MASLDSLNLSFLALRSSKGIYGSHGQVLQYSPILEIFPFDRAPTGQQIGS